MTLTVALGVESGMVFATDSRGTIGDPRGITAQNDTIKKQYILSTHTVLQMSGANETGAMLIEEIQKWCEKQENPTTTDIMYQTRKILITRYNEWFAGMPPIPLQNVQVPPRPQLNITICGYDIKSNHNPVQRIYLLSSSMNFPPQLFNTNMCLTGIPQYAIYLLHRLFTPTMPLSSAVRLAAYVITETATQDGKVGGPLQIIQMDVKNGAKGLNTDEINNIMKENNKINTKLRNLFLR